MATAAARHWLLTCDISQKIEKTHYKYLKFHVYKWKLSFLLLFWARNRHNLVVSTWYLPQLVHYCCDKDHDQSNLEGKGGPSLMEIRAGTQVGQVPGGRRVEGPLCCWENTDLEGAKSRSMAHLLKWMGSAPGFAWEREGGREEGDTCVCWCKCP